MFSSEQFPRSHRRLALFGGLPGRHYHILLSVRDRAAMGSRAAVRAAGLAPFAVSGAHKALAYGLSAVMSTLLGMLAGVGGGMARHPAGGYSGRAARRLVCRGGVARRRNDLQVAILLYPGITAPPQRGRPWEVLFSCPPRRRKRSRAAKAPKLDIRGIVWAASAVLRTRCRTSRRPTRARSQRRLLRCASPLTAPSGARTLPRCARRRESERLWSSRPKKKPRGLVSPDCRLPPQPKSVPPPLVCAHAGPAGFRFSHQWADLGTGVL